MDVVLGDDANDDFSLDDLTGWSDCDYDRKFEAPFIAQAPAIHPVKQPREKSGKQKKAGRVGVALPSPVKDPPPATLQRRLSGSVSHAESSSASLAATQGLETSSSGHSEYETGLSSESSYQSESFSPSSSAILDPVMILPVQEKTSPLAKPFTVYHYTSAQHKPKQSQRAVQFHVVGLLSEDDSRLASEPRSEHLPPLTALRDAPGAPSAKPALWTIEEPSPTQGVVHEPQRQATQRAQPTSSTRRSGMVVTQKHSSTPPRPNARVSHNSAAHKRLLAKLDKPTVRVQIALAHSHGSSSRRYSDAGKRSQETQQIALDSGYLPNTLHASRRRSLSSMSLIDEEEVLMNEINGDLQDTTTHDRRLS